MRKSDFEHADKQTILTVLNPMDDQSSVQGQENDFEIKDSSTKVRFPREMFMKKPNLYLEMFVLQSSEKSEPLAILRFTWLSQLQLEDPIRRFWTQLGL